MVNPVVARIILAVLLLGSLAAPSLAGGAWVPKPGNGDTFLGYSVKTADTSWNPNGDTRYHDSWHIFRYVYQGSEVGLGKGVSFRYLVLYLDGLEGERGHLEHNAGFSELFLGLKLRLREGRWPMALALNVRTSYLYDLPGVYDRHLFVPDEDDIDGDGDTAEAIFSGVSPEWRGLLGEDYGVSLLVSRSIRDGGWLNMELGYRYRTTNLSDEIPLVVELGYPLGWKQLILKASFNWIHSVGNHDLDRGRQDRFGCSANNCFPDSSYMVLGGGIFRHFGERSQWWVEGGVNEWLWGRSSRKYEEPYFTVGRKF